ncbi:MAG: chemotaxis response regulator protein-glutamate methylesterase [Phycisphaeraceae bacterium]
MNVAPSLPPAQVIRVLVVDDSAFMRRAITQMLEHDPRIQVIATARDGAEALDEALTLKPDVITLDLEMPNVDGLTALQRIMAECPTNVIILSSLTTAGSHAALRAMSLGAADILAKDVSQVSLSITRMQSDLIASVHALAAKPRQAGTQARHLKAHVKDFVLRERDVDVICIGSSTGGPACLETILKQFPASLRVPVVIAQHMPGLFTRSLAERLNELCPLTVQHADVDQALLPGHVYVAMGGNQARLHATPGRSLRLELSDDPPDALYKPSVDILFASAAQAFRSRVLAVVLTGMGTDGLIGSGDLRTAGAKIIAQNADSCIVYGMPKAVTENGLVDASLDPSDIARFFQKLVTTATPHGSHHK